jgi:hypothetical protein
MDAAPIKYMLERFLRQCGTLEHLALGLPASNFQRLRTSQTAARVDGYLAVLQQPVPPQSTPSTATSTMEHDLRMFFHVIILIWP